MTGKAIRIVATASLLLTIASSALAQNVVTEHRYNRYLNHHPRVASQIRSDPNLIHDRTYIRNHPEYHAFLANHRHLRRYEKRHS